jgi:hypothetical protein
MIPHVGCNRADSVLADRAPHLTREPWTRGAAAMETAWMWPWRRQRRDQACRDREVEPDGQAALERLTDESSAWRQSERRRL